MSIYGALFSGVSGLSAQAQALGMISDNISNANTVGYKGTTARFNTLVTGSASSQYSPGGVRSLPFQKIDRQGLLQGSASPTDLGIAGNGFFVVNKNAGNVDGGHLFTRAGNFTTDVSGRLVTGSGYFVQGWKLDDAGNLPANSALLAGLETVDLSNLSGSAVPTSNARLGLNLPATAAVGETFNSSVQIFDKQGSNQSLSLNWAKTAANTWSLAAALPGSGNFASDDTGAATLDNGQLTPVALGSVVFNADGTMNSITPAAPYGAADADGNLTMLVDYDGAAGTTAAQDRQRITLNLGTPGGTNGLTQYAGSFATSAIDQDGRTSGMYSGVRVNDAGIVTALFDNGQMRDIYKLPVATFRNPSGLELQDGNTFSQTNISGDVRLMEANTVGAGSITPNSLEASNVDMAEEFTNMIVTQRAYSANAKVITTADEMLEELMRVK